jgi:hypothetical protein
VVLVAQEIFMLVALVHLELEHLLVAVGAVLGFLVLAQMVLEKMAVTVVTVAVVAVVLPH